MATNYVNDFNFDISIIVAADKRGNAKLGWINLERGESVVGKNLHKFAQGQNSENQAVCLSVIAAKLADMMQKEEINGKNVLVVLPDSVAPRAYEVKGIINKAGDDRSFEELRDQVLTKVIKDWMPETWQQSLIEFVTSVCCLVTECQARIDFMRKSDLYERELVGGDFEAGQKVVIKKGGEVENSDARVSSYVKEGEYTVLDRSYDSRSGKVSKLTINRWELTETVPNTVRNLQLLNEAVTAALPSVKLLEVKLEA